MAEEPKRVLEGQPVMEGGLAGPRRDPVEHNAAKRPDVHGRVLAIALALAVLLMIGIRLGPSLLGLRVFLGLDLLYMFAPWSSLPGSHPVTTSIYVSDLLDATIPVLHEVAQRFAQGDLASWSSLTGGGSPVLATPNYGLISPGRWVYLFLPIWLAPGWSKLLELAFAAIFTYLLVRRLDGSKVAAGLAGFVYPMTGFMISWTSWPQVAVGSVIPMLFWAIERCLQERRVRSAIPISVAVALLLFGGFPAVAGQALYFAAGYALLRLVSRHRRDIRRIVRDGLVLVAAVAIGLGLSAVQLLPFLKGIIANVDLSYRDGGFFHHDELVSMLTTVFPLSFAGNHLSTGPTPMNINTYVGATVLLLGVLGVFYAMTGRVRGSAGAYFVGMIFFIVALLWFQGAWSNWMDHLPVFHGNPIGRLRSQLGLPVAVLAAAGFDLLRGTSLSPGWARVSEPHLRRLTALVAALVCCLVLGVGIKIARGPYIGLSEARGLDVVIAVAPLVLIAVLLFVGIRVSAARLLAMIAVIASVSVQAIAASGFYWPTADRSQFYPTTNGIRYLQRSLDHDRMATLGYAIRPDITAYYGLRVLNGHMFFPKPMKSVIQGIEPGSFPTGATYSIFWPGKPEVLASPGLGRMGVRYMVGEANTVVPHRANTAVPIYGEADPLPAQSGLKTLTAGKAIRSVIRGGGLRGVNLPLRAASANEITVVLRRSDGTTIAKNTRDVEAGSTTVPVPLAAEPSGAGQADPGRPITVEISARHPGVVVTTDAGGQARFQAVRPNQVTSRIRLAYAGDNLVIWERLDYVPRLHWASRVVSISDDRARLAAVTKSPLEAHAVILAQAPPADFAPSDTQPRDFTVEEDSGDTIRVRVRTDHPGYVVVTDNIQTDFTAFVDGRSAPIVDADYAGGAVYVGAGTHEVALRNEPAGRQTGAGLTGLSAMLLTLAALPPLWWTRFGTRFRRLASGRSTKA